MKKNAQDLISLHAQELFEKYKEKNGELEDMKAEKHLGFCDECVSLDDLLDKINRVKDKYMGWNIVIDSIDYRSISFEMTKKESEEEREIRFEHERSYCEKKAKDAYINRMKKELELKLYTELFQE